MARQKFPMGGMGGMNMNNMIKQAQKMQEDLLKAQESFDAEVMDVTSGGGAVKLKISGKNEIQELKLDPEVVDPEDVEMLEDLIVAAVNEGIKTVEKAKQEKMGKVTGNLGGMPGLF
ncbi:YbaB/EbfC family nucleoid-associated protein [Acetivibrio sp. MSJd-27]|uniref:YbaB/EbfC family nucleoid-associated protein n=1 Tax=Acetivibrio sp. MSJd-27 TaxID=2841523 RepID=UPI001C0FA4A3|nr:YbaB/EbfC family nucleoid-associated protein [Acetivibrio sp. MSJd-27]MBU5449890.1 YbaB/EbfC family nucleoid-associated protein [Acetivibrio sp. MSJd-27]